MKKRVYIAGPYRAENAWEIEQNIRSAERSILPIAQAGGNPLCPHSMFRYFQGAMPDEFWLSSTLEWLEACDAIYMGPGWRTSNGSRAEENRALDIGIPVFYELDSLLDWLRGMG